jgi:YVTN family beta-propeller protein
VPFGNPVAAGTGPAAAIFDPIGYYELFVANKSSNTISSFAYDINIGVLTQAAPPIATGTAPTSLVGWNLTDTTGAVYVTNSGSSPGTVSTYSDNAGVLSAFGTSLSSGPDPTASLLSADADLFVTNAGANTVSNFAINQITGGLSSTGVIPDVTGAGPNSVAAGSLLSAGEFSGTATVTVGTAVLSVDSVAQGALAVGDVVSGTGIASGTTIVSFGTGTGGTGTYNLSAAATATVSTAESITGYAYSAYVAATATEVSGSNVLTVTSVTTGTLLVGDVLYAVGLPSGTSIVSFGTGAGGAGTYNLSAEATDSGEASVNVDNYQEYVFVGNSDGSISVLLNAMPGNGLTSLQQYPAAIAGLSAVAFYPLYLGATPGYLYAAGTNGVYVFATQGQALLTGQITGSPYAAGSSPSSITIFGHYLYVTNSGDGTVSGFVIDSTTGALTGIPGSPFPCGSAPSSIIATSRPESD